MAYEFLQFLYSLRIVYTHVVCFNQIHLLSLHSRNFHIPHYFPLKLCVL